MSNDSNEQGNDTTGPAFQVGDRVRYRLTPLADGEGVVALISDNPTYLVGLGGPRERNGWMTVRGDDGEWHTMRAEDATLISRATPAPAPAQTASEPVVERCDRCGSLAMESWQLYRCETCGDLVCSDCLTFDGRMPVCKSCRERSEPATPAPALDTPPALDTHTLELPVDVVCGWCDGVGVVGDGERCGPCCGEGRVSDTIRLSDEAMDRLAAALVKRLARQQRLSSGSRY